MGCADMPEVAASFKDKAELRRLFRRLLPERLTGRVQLMEDDLKALLLDVPPPSRLQVWMGFSALLSPASSKGGVSSVWGETLTLPRSGEAQPTNELPVHTVEDFQRLLVRKFGSVYAGWVKYVDVTDHNHVPLNEFVQRAKRIGVSGNVKRLFDTMAAFQRKAEEVHGSLKQTAYALDLDKNNRIDEEEFKRGVAALGYTQEDAAHLFGLLRPEKGRHFLVAKDFVPLPLGTDTRVTSTLGPLPPDNAGEGVPRKRRVNSGKKTIESSSSTTTATSRPETPDSHAF